MTLFKQGSFKLHSGKMSDWKIECDSLTDDDWKTIAHLIARHFNFREVHGVPNGGLKLAKLLEKHINKDAKNVLIVDDVYTTGTSMWEMQIKLQETVDTNHIRGVVVFARGEVERWISPLFQYELGD